MSHLTASYTHSQSAAALCRSRPLTERTRHTLRSRTQCTASIPDQPLEQQDPEARFRRFGKDFNNWPRLGDLIESAPRVRVRRPADRQRDQLAELAVLNNRLAGSEAWQARKKLEYLKIRRKQWEKIYNYITCKDAEATLSRIEEANKKVDEALSDESRERVGVGALKRQLVQLQAEVNHAHKRLHLTQARVDHNLRRINSLKVEALRLERLQSSSLATSTGAEPSAPHADSAPLRQAQQLPNRIASCGSRAQTASAQLASAAVLAPSQAAAAPAALPNAPALARRKRDKRGLHSSLEMEQGLRDFWYPVLFSGKLAADALLPVQLFDEPWVVFRDENGQPACVRDECAHRACPLSLGKVVKGQVQCPYHGWEYNAEGHCTAMPSTVQCLGVSVASLPCVERDGFVWIWPGHGTPGELPTFSRPPEGFEIHAEIEVEVSVEHGLLMENLLDLAHAPFTHTSTFAKGWPVPNFVKFQASQLLSGNWDPYPIDMAFQPTCMVLSLIGLAQPGKIQRGQRAQECRNHLHQLHVCLPSKPGHTRLLYRMSLDFLHWTRHLPGIQSLWNRIAAQVLGEDLVLVRGQQERMLAGSDTWAHPVSYDKLAVRYRRWRNSVDGSPAQRYAADAAVRDCVLSAGELFALDEDECLQCEVDYED